MIDTDFPFVSWPAYFALCHYILCIIYPSDGKYWVIFLLKGDETSMELNMSADEVLGHIVQLHNTGESLAKKNVKKLHPDLMKNALYYYPKLGTCFAKDRSG